MLLEERIKSTIRDIPDFPKPGIIFKDITPILKDPILCRDIADEMVKRLAHTPISAVVGIESRGFLFGMMIAQRLNVPFIPIRKIGKLPAKTIQQKYDLEYGNATVEIHEDALLPGQQVLLHDDLLATGGTAVASAKLIEKLGAKVSAASFIVNLEFLGGEDLIAKYCNKIINLTTY